MRHLRKVKCANCGSAPSADAVCPVCHTTDWIWHCERHGLPANETGCKQCGYAFKGTRYARPDELAEALNANWGEALEAVARQPLVGWAKEGLGNLTLAAQLRRCAESDKGHPNAALAGALGLLKPQATLSWKGRQLWRDDFAVTGEPRPHPEVEMVREVLTSDLANWLHDSPVHEWLGEVAGLCQRRSVALQINDPSKATDLQWWWLLAEAKALKAAGNRMRRVFVSSKDAEIAALFPKKELSEEEALRLGNAPAEVMLTVENAWEELVGLTLPTLAELEARAQRRPCTRQELQMMEGELASTLGLLRKQREELRPRQANLPEPTALIQATERVRTALHQAVAAHEKASQTVAGIRDLVSRQHVGRATAEAAKAEAMVADFNDLSLDFVAEARVEYERLRRRLLAGGLLIAAAMLLTLVIVKLSQHATH